VNESTGLKQCEECETGSCRISGLAAAFLPYLRDIGRLRPPLVGGPSGEADVFTALLAACSTSPGRASSAANRSSRDVPTRTFARICADGGGRVGVERRGDPLAHLGYSRGLTARSASASVRKLRTRASFPPVMKNAE
jgi:hypothetical protein